jgi:antitoxin CptB
MSDHPPQSGDGATAIRHQRLRWRSRRGLLELELLLQAFLDARLADLDADRLTELEALVEFDDVDVHEWLLGRRPPPTALRRVVTEIREQLGLGE